MAIEYSDQEIVEALIQLAVNKYNFQKTAAELGLVENTLRRWAKDNKRPGVAPLLERAVEHLLSTIPTNMNGQEWAVALGILLDKWLLFTGRATSRTESVVRKFEEMEDQELENVLAEASRIIDEASRSS